MLPKFIIEMKRAYVADVSVRLAWYITIESPGELKQALDSGS